MILAKKSQMKNPTEHSSEYLFSKNEVSPNIKSCIVIPVKDEEAYILKTLTSFLNQVDIFGEPLDFDQFEILVLANNCTDNSVALIKKFQLNYPHLNLYLDEVKLSPANANIGYVRRKLMECAFARLSKNGGGVIMTTDGDTMVASDWIAHTHWEIDNGAEVVGGRILLSDNELADLDEFTSTHHFKDEEYRLLIAELEGKIMNSEFDPNPRHHQHFNGSFAITTQCYKRSGGVPEVKYLEDCAFFERLETVDAKIRHSHKVVVYTSARCIGRTEIGLSYQLNVWKNLANHADDYFVESCASIIQRFTQKRNLIKLWEFKNQTESEFFQKLQKIAPEITASEKIYSLLISSIYFGEWYEKLIQQKQIHWNRKFPDVPIDTAIKDLQSKLQEYSDYDFAQTSIL